MKTTNKIFAVIALLSVLLSIVVISSSAQIIYTPVRAGGLGYRVVLPLKRKINGIMSNSNTVSHVSTVDSLYYYPSIEYTGAGNLYQADASLNSTNYTINFSNGKIIKDSLVNVTVHNDTGSYSEWYLDGIDYSIRTTPFGSASYYTLNKYGNEWYNNLEARQYYRSQMNGSKIASDRNDFVANTMYYYDDIISVSRLDGMTRVLPSSITRHIVCDYAVAFPSIVGGVAQFDAVACMVPAEVQFVFKGKRLSDTLPEYETIDCRFSVPVVFDVNEDIIPHEASSAAIINQFNQLANIANNKITTVQYNFDMVPVWDELVQYCQDRQITYIMDLQFEPVIDYFLGNGQQLFMDNYYIDGFIDYFGTVPCIAEYLNYTDVSAMWHGDSVIIDEKYVDVVDYISGDIFDESFITIKNEYTTLDGLSLTSWLGDALSGIMDVQIFGGNLSIGTILYVCLGIGFLVMVIKFFAGG